MRSTSRALCFAALASFPAAPAAACGISVSGVAFGAYDTFSASPLTSAAQIQLDCPNASANPEIQLGPGTGSYAARELSGPAGARLQYNLYTSATYLTVWGDGSGGTGTVFPPRVQGKTFRTTIYGRIPARQNVRAGSYGDTIFVTVVF